MLAFTSAAERPERRERATTPFPLERPLSSLGVRCAPGEQPADELTNLREPPSRPNV